MTAGSNTAGNLSGGRARTACTYFVKKLHVRSFFCVDGPDRGHRLPRSEGIRPHKGAELRDLMETAMVDLADAMMGAEPGRFRRYCTSGLRGTARLPSRFSVTAPTTLATNA